jgi:hypothetical protein
MNQSHIKLIVLVTGLAWHLGAVATPLSKAEYRDSHERISAEHKSAKAGCNSMNGNAQDICSAEANGQNQVALAELEAKYKPSAKNSARLLVAKAEADYAIAIERCDDLAGNAKDVCVKEAKSAEIAAKADGKAKAKSKAAGKAADEKSAAAREKGMRKSNEAQENATEEKRDAGYAVAKEKCDVLTGNDKDSCIDKAKLTFGKS